MLELSQLAFAVSGTYSAANSTFTAAATNTAGADTLLVTLTAGTTSYTAGTDTLVLTGVNAGTVTTNNIV